MPHTRAIGTAGLAGEFLQAAKSREVDSPAVSLVPFFLLGHSIELSLKSVLLAHGTTDGALRDLGHDLMAVLEATDEVLPHDSPVRLPADDRQRLALLSPVYKAKALEYLIPGYMTLPDLPDLLALTEGLAAHVEVHVDNVVRSLME